MELIFKVENGFYGYSSKKNILENISLTINKGEVLSILGPNGIGKTTLLKCMMGLFKWKQGKNLINNISMDCLSYKDIWSKISYVPQAKASNLSYTVKEMILLGRSSHINLWSQPKKVDLEIVEEVMKLVGIQDFKDKNCNELSGGQLQMVLIARALASKPEMLVLDEPESNLDFKNQLIILDIIQKLSKNHDISCIINTHYPEHAIRISNKSLILCKNNEKHYGDTKEVINKDNMKKAFEVEVLIEKVEFKNKILTHIIPVSF